MQDGRLSSRKEKGEKRSYLTATQLSTGRPRLLPLLALALDASRLPATASWFSKPGKLIKHRPLEVELSSLKNNTQTLCHFTLTRTKTQYFTCFHWWFSAVLILRYNNDYDFSNLNISSTLPHVDFAIICRFGSPWQALEGTRCP